MMRIVAALPLIVLCSATAASAAPFTWQIAGTIASVNPSAALPPGGNPFTVGNAFTLNFTLDPSVPDSSPSPTCGAYGAIGPPSPVTQAQLTTPGFTATGNSGIYTIHSSSYVTPAPGDCLTIPPGPNSGRLRIMFSNGYIATLDFGGTFATDAIVTDISNFHPFSSVFSYADFPDRTNTVAGGTITSLTAVPAVPEPATLSLLALGTLAGWSRRSRKGRCA